MVKVRSKHIAVSSIICMVMLSSVLPVITSSELDVGSSSDIFVDDDAPALWYDATHVKTIQEGIVNASINATIHVCNGTYWENIVVDKPVDIIGESKTQTIINGSGIDDVVSITADGVHLSGCTIENSGDTGHAEWDSGLKIQADNTTISNCIITKNNYHGIHLSMADNNTIEDTEISDNAIYGIVIYGDSDYNLVNNCQIYENGGNPFSGGGILLWVGTIKNKVMANEIYYNTGDGVYGYNWESNWSSEYHITANHIHNNSEAGIQLGKGSSNNSIIDNTCKDNLFGITLYFSDKNMVTQNILNNNTIGLNIIDAYDNIVYWNNFLSNENHATDRNMNSWDNGYPAGGNYWDNYTGTDNFYGPDQDMIGSDGFGDTPFMIPKGNNNDQYPLINPWTPPEELSVIPWISWYPNAKIPQTQVTMNVTDGNQSYFLINLSNVPNGYHVIDGEYFGWCFEKQAPMTRNQCHPVRLCHSYDPDMPEVFKDVDWSMINYVINDKGNRSKEVLQDAIWSYIEGVEPSSSEAAMLLEEALSHSSGFTPSIGDKLAVLVYLDPTANLPVDYPSVQNTFIEITLNYTSCDTTFWIDHPNEWPSMMDPSDLVGDYFNVPYYEEFESHNISQILNDEINESIPLIAKFIYGGLLKEAFTGLLNTYSSCIHYPVTSDQIIVSVHDAFSSIGKMGLLYLIYEVYNLIGSNCDDIDCCCPCCP